MTAFQAGAGYGDDRPEERGSPAAIFDHAARLRSYELLAGLQSALDSAPAEAENTG